MITHWKANIGCTRINKLCYQSQFNVYTSLHMYLYILQELYIALLNVAETTHVAYFIFLLDQNA